MAPHTVMALTNTAVSPIGTSAQEGAQRRAARSAEYRAEKERLALWEEIATQLILYRTRHGLTQADLAERVGTSHSAVSRLESGQHATNVETLRRIAKALGLTLRIVLQPAEQSPAPDGRSHTLTTEGRSHGRTQLHRSARQA